MIISKTPFRISFFGGGTDFPAWYKEHGGMVLSTSIDKYCYITCRHLPPFFEYKHRIVYSKNENVSSIEQIEHPSVRETLRYMNIERGLEIHHDADLPARSGLGSSSSFTVGLLNSLSALGGKMMSPKNLADSAIHIEQKLIRENVGSQDQVAAAYGGFNIIKFHESGEINVLPMIFSSESRRFLESSLLFAYIGRPRISSDIAGDQIRALREKRRELQSMTSLANEAIDILGTGRNIVNQFGFLLNETWKLKRSLTDKISSQYIDEVYANARAAGAIGGKLLGAGAGGFMVFVAEPKLHTKIKARLNKILFVPIKLSNSGSQIIFCNRNDD